MSRKIKQYCHTYDSLSRGGFDPFVEHVRAYLKGEKSIPVALTHGIHDDKIYFTFSTALLEEAASNPKKLKKPYESAVAFGFRGYSRGKQNGIFLLRKHDKGLVRACGNLASKLSDDIKQDLEISDSGLDELRKVKIVWHNPSGERVVGVYSTQKNSMIFLDFASY